VGSEMCIRDSYSNEEGHHQWEKSGYRISSFR
jgi:hypothetical protein